MILVLTDRGYTSISTNLYYFYCFLKAIIYSGNKRSTPYFFFQTRGFNIQNLGRNINN